MDNSLNQFAGRCQAPAQGFAGTQWHDGFAGKGISGRTVHWLRCRVTVPVFNGSP